MQVVPQILPVAILILGIGGTGKTSAAKRLTAELLRKGYDVVYIAFDELRKQLAPPGTDPFSSDAEVKKVIYQEARRRFSEWLSQGKSLVIDCGLSKESIRRELQGGIPGLRIVHLHCPLAVAIYRDSKRSLFQRHERGRFLHLRAVWCRFLGRQSGHRHFFPQPGITYKFEYSQCAELHVNTAFKSPQRVADCIIVGLGMA